MTEQLEFLLDQPVNFHTDLETEYCVYVHLKATDGLPFYVGMGKPARPFDFEARNERWIHMNSKYGCIPVVLQSCMSRQAAFDKEKTVVDSLRKAGVELCNQVEGGNVKPTRKIVGDIVLDGSELVLQPCKKCGKTHAHLTLSENKKDQNGVVCANCDQWLGFLSKKHGVVGA